jgi:hypothetical protein
MVAVICSASFKAISVFPISMLISWEKVGKTHKIPILNNKEYKVKFFLIPKTLMLVFL